MSLVRLTHDLIVNPEHVASVSWDRSSSCTILVIAMADGTAHRIRHEPSYLDGIDCYKVESALLATGEAKA